MTFAIPDSRILFVPRPGRLSAFVQSRLRSLDIDMGTVETILAHYGVSPKGTPRNLPNARRNRNLIVNTTRGRKILKLYRKDWLPSTIQFEHSILNELARQDEPAPRLMRTTNGRTVVKHHTQHYALFDFIPGKTYTSSFLLRPHRLRLMHLSGKTLALLHQRLIGFQPDSFHHLGFGDYRGARHRDVMWHEKKLAELDAASRHIDAPEDRALADQLRQKSDAILARLGQLDQQLSTLELTRLVIHGDYGLHNLLFQSVDHATAIDFELARLEWRLCDLVSCLSKLRYGNGRHDFESMTHFMDGYTEAFPIDDDEWHYLPQVWQYYRLMGAVQYWKSYFETNGPVRKLYSALDSVSHAEWAQQQPEQILSINRQRRGKARV